MDQWEGQNLARSPGNLISDVRRVHLDPGQGYRIKLELSKKISPIEAPADTSWVKRIKFQSPLLTRFWGRPIYIGATVLLPKGYEEHPGVLYPDGVHPGPLQSRRSLQLLHAIQSQRKELGSRAGQLSHCGPLEHRRATSRPPSTDRIRFLQRVEFR